MRPWWRSAVGRVRNFWRKPSAQQVVRSGATQADDGFCFRARFRVQNGLRFQTGQTELVLTHNNESAVIRPKTEGKTLDLSGEFILTGSQYPSEDEALIAGERWISRLKIIAAHLHVGIDFRGQALPGGWTPHGLEMIRAATGEHVLNDNYGLQVFKCDSDPIFMSGQGQITVGMPNIQLMNALTATAGNADELTDQEQLGYDLYSSSFFEPATDARLVTLVTALEAIATQQTRSEEALAHIDQLIQLTADSTALPTSEKSSITKSLEQLRRESVGRAGRRLARTLGDRRYQGEQAVTFFNRCYQIRSDLVHGNIPRPTPREIANRAGGLVAFVGDIISRRAVDGNGDGGP